MVNRIPEISLAFDKVVNNVQITDGGAVQDSLTFAGNAVEAALTFGLASQSNALEVLEKQARRILYTVSFHKNIMH